MIKLKNILTEAKELPQKEIDFIAKLTPRLAPKINIKNTPCQRNRGMPEGFASGFK